MEMQNLKLVVSKFYIIYITIFWIVVNIVYNLSLILLKDCIAKILYLFFIFPTGKNIL